MIKFIKKHKLNFISYLFCVFAMALFTIISFSCKTYAFTIDSNGNLVGDNLFDYTNLNNYQLIGNNASSFYSYDNGVLETTHNSWFQNIGIRINLQANTTYTISAYSYATYGNSFIRMSSNNPDGTDLGYINFTNNNEYTYNYFTFTTTQSNCVLSIGVAYNGQSTGYFKSIMLNVGNTPQQFEPYGVWYSETNYDTIENLYDNALSQYNDLALGNNYGYWKYIDYVEFYVNNSNIFVPNTNEQNEWEISDLYNNNILKIGGYFDTFPLTMYPYQSDYNQVDTYINFKSYTPSDSFIVSFNNCDGCNVVINDDNSNSFTTTISETNYLIDINEIRKYIPNFSIYIIEMYIRPNNAEQNGIYFANNDYITAYNKGYNVATSNADRKYIPQITDLQNQINSLNNNIIELSNNIETLRALNTDLQNQINNSYSWQNLFFAFADTPFKVVSNVLGFELFGLNLFATFIGMITVFGVVYLLKKFL